MKKENCGDITQDQITQRENEVKELVRKAEFRLEHGAWRRALHHLQQAEKIARTYDPI